MKRSYIRMTAMIAIAFVCFILQPVSAQENQTLTLDSCYAMAKRNFPLVKQYGLIDKSTEFSIANSAKGILPKILIGGQATYQSEVTKVPIDIPNVDIQELSKDQYRLYAEVSQSLTDLFIVNHQKDYVAANSVVREKNVEVELYKLYERINDLYFGILIIEGRIDQIELMKKDINTAIKNTKAAIENGVALKSSADVLKAELLKTDQNMIELNSSHSAFLDMLSLFINRKLDGNIALQITETGSLSSAINRPELLLYKMKKASFDAERKLISDRTLPRFNVFFQGGFGRPGLDMLNNDFSPYFITGLRLNWNFSGYYTSGNEKKLISLDQKSLEIEREVFLFNVELQLKKQNAEISKFQKLISSDEELIELRTRIKNTAKNQLENGTATVNDYLIYLNAEDQARQNQLLHKIMLEKAKYDYQTTSGNPVSPNNSNND